MDEFERPDFKTRFQPGNKIWMRGLPGRTPVFNSADELWKEAVEYFEWVDDNPILEEKLVSSNGVSGSASLSKMRAMSIDALLSYLNIGDSLWSNYKKNPVFMGTIENICRIIRLQKFEGAAAGIFNSTLISRDLGLAEKVHAELTGKDGESLHPRNITGETPVDEAAEIYSSEVLGR